jgi:nucleoside-diphosphate-sugar epimerase
VEKARTLLGWEARIGVSQGIAQTVEWLRARPELAGAPASVADRG